MAILLTLVRLEAKATDLVISINVPHLPGQYVSGEVNGGVEMEKARLGLLVERAVGMRERLMRSFEVREWGLFV